MKLNLGCGHTNLPGWLNCDREPGQNVDIVLDLNDPLPFKDDFADEILMAHVLEHIQNWHLVVEDCHRVLKPGGILTIKVPYGVNGDPFHIRFFYPHSMVHFLSEGDGRNRSLEVCKLPIFKLEDRSVWRVFPFTWHLNKYLRLKLYRNQIVGRPVGIDWVLRKPLNGDMT